MIVFFKLWIQLQNLDFAVQNYCASEINGFGGKPYQANQKVITVGNSLPFLSVTLAV
jgi:hypothetical protein